MRHKDLLPWLAAVLVACGAFGVWVLSSAKETAAAPHAEIANVSTKVEMIKSDVQTQISTMDKRISDVDGKVVALAGKMDAQSKETQAGFAAVSAQIEQSKQAQVQQVTNLTTLLLTGQIVVPHRETRAPR